MLYVTLADIAKDKKDEVVESAALERALEGDPADLHLRFRVALLYGEMKNDCLAAFHYKLRLAQDQDVGTMNNLAIAFDTLGLRGMAIELYESAAQMLPLAKANLGNVFVTAGFLSRGDELARQALTEPGDETATQAAKVLTRIQDQRAEEEKKATELILRAETERAFRSRFADGVLSSLVKITGIYETKHGALSFEQSGDTIIGTASVKVPETGFFAATATLLGGMGSSGPTEPEIRTLRFQASIVGRSGRFTMKNRQGRESLLGLRPVSETTGLIIVAADGESFDVLEEGEMPTIYTAKRTIEPGNSAA
jgi:hypothetical protein